MCSRTLVLVTAVIVLCCSGPAWAFRCGNRIVTENMHEAEVLGACGPPATTRYIGRTLRTVDIPRRHRHGNWMIGRFPAYNLAQEVIVTEYVYNFGPRRLMRRLVFEGGILTSIEELGYGYLEK